MHHSCWLLPLCHFNSYLYKLSLSETVILRCLSFFYHVFSKCVTKHIEQMYMMVKVPGSPLQLQTNSRENWQQNSGGRSFMLDSLNKLFLEIIRALLHEIITVHFGYKKVCQMGTIIVCQMIIKNKGWKWF